MRSVIVACLCVLAVVCLTEARSLKEEKIFSARTKSRILAELKARRASLDKKGLGDDDSEDGSFSTVGLHAALYVLDCLSDVDLMNKVDDNAWTLVTGDETQYAEFKMLYEGEPFFPCLSFGRGVYFYEKMPQLRPMLNEEFTKYKEAHKCETLDGLGEKLRQMEGLPPFVEGVVEYMDYHCNARKQQVEEKAEVTDDLVSTVAFDAIMFAGQCLASGKQSEECKATLDGVEAYFNSITFIIVTHMTTTEQEIEKLFADFLAYESNPDPSLLEGHMFGSQYLEALMTVIYIDEQFEYYNEMYTCGELEETFEKMHTALNSLSGQTLKNVGEMAQLIEEMAERECAKFEEDDGEDSEDSQSDMDKTVDVDSQVQKKAVAGKAANLFRARNTAASRNAAATRNEQPINQKMLALRKILSELLDKE